MALGKEEKGREKVEDYNARVDKKNHKLYDDNNDDYDRDVDGRKNGR